MKQNQAYPGPAGVAAAADIQVTVDGQDLFVHDTPVAAFAGFALAAPASVTMRRTRPFQRVVVRPLSRGIRAQVDGNTVRFALDAPATLSVEFDDDIRRPLFLFANAPEIDAPDPADGNVIRFDAGKVHEAGEIRLRSNQTLYIPAGTIVRGRVVADDASRIRICGRGILDGSANVEPRGQRLVLLRNCQDVRVEGVTLLDSQTWTLMLWGCRDVLVQDVRTIGFHGGDDGIDIVSCRNVIMRGCFSRTKDDCVAIKAFPFRDVMPQPGQFDVADVLIERCVFWNAEWGNALEIGYETRTESISNITFRDCDVIHCEREGYTSGGTLTIHNGDRAHVSNVLYEDIRVEDSREKLIDFKIAHTRYSRDEQRGQISGVTLRNIAIVDGPLPVSIIQGFDHEHMIRQIAIENLRYRGRPLRDALEAKVVLELISSVRFIDGEAYMH